MGKVVGKGIRGVLVGMLVLLACKGTTEPPPPPEPTVEVVFTPNPLYFGRIPVGSSATRELLIFNNSSKPTTLQSFAIEGPNAGDFSLSPSVPTPPVTLDPLESVALPFQYQPSAAASAQAFFSVTTQAGAFVDTLQGEGTGDVGGITPFERILGTTRDDGAGAVIATSDQGYLLVGSTIPPGTEEFADVYVVKTDARGKVLWSVNEGGSESDGAGGVVPHPDGSFLIVGNTSSFGAGGQDGYLIKLSGAGQTEWTRTVGGPFTDQLTEVVLLDNGDFLLTGATLKSSGSDRDAWVLRVDASGNPLWETTVGDNNAGEIFYSGVEALADSLLLLVGAVASGQTGDFDILITLVNGDGNVLWSRTYGAVGQELWEEAFDVAMTNDGNFVLCGYTSSQGAGGRDVYVLKIDASGNLIWERTFGGPRNESTGTILIAPSGEIYLGGSAVTRVTQQSQFTDAYLLKLTESGDLLWSLTLGGDGNESVADLLLASDGGIVVCGNTSSYSKSNDIYFLKVTPDGSLVYANLPENEWSSFARNAYKEDFGMFAPQ